MELFGILVSLVIALLGGYFLGRRPAGPRKPRKKIRVEVPFKEARAEGLVGLDALSEKDPQDPGIDPSAGPLRMKVSPPQHVGRRRLIVVTYRLPIHVSRGEDGKYSIEWEDRRSPLANIRDLENTDVHWVGWAGVDIPAKDRDEFEEFLRQHRCYPVFLEKDLRRRFFDGFCRSVLWPLFHYEMPTHNPNFALEWDDVWQAYNAVNLKFARAASLLVEDPHDTIWVQNYHLLLAPSFLRRSVPRCKIGIFVHTTWATSDVFRCLPGRETILRGMLSADLVGFHTYDYARHFLSCCKRILDLDYKSTKGGNLGLTYCGREVCVRISHVAIDTQVFRDALKEQKTLDAIEEIRKLHGKRRIILSIDELDTVRGILQKIQAFRRFLWMHKGWASEVVLVQILEACSSAGRDRLRTQIMDEVKDIQSKYGPDVVHVIHCSTLRPLSDRGNIPKELDRAQFLEINKLVAYYSQADVALFSQFWDGLNLMPFELTACHIQNGAKPPAALIVSEFMGCWRSLSGAHRVNPWRLSEIVDHIHEALVETPQERKIKHRRRYKFLFNHTFTRWAKGFLSDLDKAAAGGDHLNFVQVGFGSNVRLIGLRADLTHLEEGHFVPAYKRASRRVIIFDYGGTLTNGDLKILRPPSDAVLHHLTALTNDPRNFIFIVSGQEKRRLDRWLPIPGLGLAAERGAFFNWPGSKTWETVEAAEQLDSTDWKPTVEQLMRDYTARTGGSFLQMKDSSMVWHYTDADPVYGEMQASELGKYLEKAIDTELLEIARYENSRKLEVKPLGVNKGLTASTIYEQALVRVRPKTGEAVRKMFKDKKDETEFVLCIGNDRGDEEMFKTLEESCDDPRTCFTCSVGIKPSRARYYVHDHGEVLDVLNALSTCTARDRDPETNEFGYDPRGPGGTSPPFGPSPGGMLSGFRSPPAEEQSISDYWTKKKRRRF